MKRCRHDLDVEICVRCMRERIAQIEAQCRWQPIETVPVDVSVIVAVPRILHHEMAVSYGIGEAHHFEKEGWYWAGNDPTDSWGGRIYPTHWMPMPDAPTALETTPTQCECRCVNTCRKDELRQIEYCREDRLTADLALETPVERNCDCRPKAALHGAHYPGCPQAKIGAKP